MQMYIKCTIWKYWFKDLVVERAINNDCMHVYFYVQNYIYTNLGIQNLRDFA